MHSENFYDHEMRTLTPKLFLQEMLGKKMRSSAIALMEVTTRQTALSHNLKGDVLRYLCSKTSSPQLKKGRMHSKLKMNAL